MKSFELEFNSESIINFLCTQRVSLARTRSQKHVLHLVTKSQRFNYHVNDEKYGDEFEKKFNSQLSELLPPRKRWVSIGEKSRKYKSNHSPIPSNKKNLISLKRTINRDIIKNPELPYLIKLDAFIQKIRNRILNPNFKINKPKIYPKPKNTIKPNSENKCRPISLFPLEDGLILSITNRYLTKAFDKHFEDSSYAFRSKKSTFTKSILSHHDCISSIQKFQIKNSYKKLWVTECDMQKFFDAVNHNVVIDLLNKLIEKNLIENSAWDFSIPKKIFIEYLNCYSFNHTVLPYNSDQQYWKEYNIPNGKFGWIKKELNNLYPDFKKQKIGIPQGGALSGLIANIVLDVADKLLLNNDVFYVRFCDDMLIISPNFRKCRKAKYTYLRALKKLKLVPHNFDKDYVATKPHITKMPNKKQFWKSKSKGPYLWDNKKYGGLKWISFVGYEISTKGYIRVRKKSFLKELKKQNELEKRYIVAIQKDRRKSPGSITQSLIHKLIGMSVGRISISNFSTAQNDLCWKNGFRNVNNNPYLTKQVQKLDRNRNRIIHRFKHIVKEIAIGDDKIISKQRQIVKYNKPFSYYYHLFERIE